MSRRSVEVLWLLVLAAMDFVTGLLLFSGDILLYLAPRMLPIAWFGFAMLCILTAFQLVRLVRTHRYEFGKQTRLYSLMFLIPMVLFVTTPPNQNTVMSLPNPGLQVVGAAQTAAQQPRQTAMPEETPQTAPTVTEPAEAAPETTPEETPEATTAPEVKVSELNDLKPCALEDSDAEFGLDTFGDYIYIPIEQLRGQKISLYGFVYKDDAFPEGTILVSRKLMTCCAADASLVGFHVRVEDADDFKTDEWVEVTGTVQAFAVPYEGSEYTMPILTGGVIRHREAPMGDPYIYPY
jgi:putative membrane protein